MPPAYNSHSAAARPTIPVPTIPGPPEQAGLPAFGGLAGAALNCRHAVDQEALYTSYTPVAPIIFPQMVLLAKLAFTLPYALVGLQFSSTILNYGAALAGLAVVIGRGTPNLGYSQKVNSPIMHVSTTNSLFSPLVVPIPASKTSAMTYGEYGVRVPLGTFLCLYGFADATAGMGYANYLFGAVTFHLIQIRQ